MRVLLTGHNGYVGTTVVGPVTIVTDIACTQPPNGPTFVWGTTWKATGVNPGEAVPEGDVLVSLWFWNVYLDYMPWSPGQP